ncbi:hypothetical protein KI387_028386, partial [Taxus chinensis]
ANLKNHLKNGSSTANEEMFNQVDEDSGEEESHDGGSQDEEEKDTIAGAMEAIQSNLGQLDDGEGLTKNCGLGADVEDLLIFDLGMEGVMHGIKRMGGPRSIPRIMIFRLLRVALG